MLTLSGVFQKWRICRIKYDQLVNMIYNIYVVMITIWSLQLSGLFFIFTAHAIVFFCFFENYYHDCFVQLQIKINKAKTIISNNCHFIRILFVDLGISPLDISWMAGLWHVPICQSSIWLSVGGQGYDMFLVVRVVPIWLHTSGHAVGIAATSESESSDY